MMVIHPNDDISVGDKFTRGHAVFKEGDDGYALGYHFHISSGIGSILRKI